MAINKTYSMKTMLFVFVCSLLISCNSAHIEEDTNLTISIRYELSYKIDLNEKVYTVFFISKPPLKIKFNLADDEIKKISDKYFTLKLYELGSLELSDSCMTYPMIYTYINVKSNSINQQIKFDENCEGFMDDSRLKLHEFTQLISDII
jgi:hypothetical protein